MKRINKKSTESGAALVEFAIVLPFLLLLLFGIVEFGLLFYNKQVLTNASREGARAGIAYEPKSGIVKIVQDYCAERLIRFGTKVDPVPSVTPDPPPSSYGQDLTVTVVYDYTFLASGLLGFGPNMQLTAQTAMKMESVAGP
jgi:hypothetical protein